MILFTVQTEFKHNWKYLTAFLLEYMQLQRVAVRQLFFEIREIGGGGGTGCNIARVQVKRQLKQKHLYPIYGIKNNIGAIIPILYKVYSSTT